MKSPYWSATLWSLLLSSQSVSSSDFGSWRSQMAFSKKLDLTSWVIDCWPFSWTFRNYRVQRTKLFIYGTQRYKMSWADSQYLSTERNRKAILKQHVMHLLRVFISSRLLYSIMQIALLCHSDTRCKSALGPTSAVTYYTAKPFVETPNKTTKLNFYF